MTSLSGNYIYEMEGVVLPFNKYDRIDDVNSNNLSYYYKRQTHTPNVSTEIDIYEDSRYHDIDTDDELDMDAPNLVEYTARDETDLLSNLKKYLATMTIPANSEASPSSLSAIPRRLTKKHRRQTGRHTKHANRARPKSFY